MRSQKIPPSLRHDVFSCALAAMFIVIAATPVRATTGGPDAHGYTYKDGGETDGPLYTWIDIVPSGAKVIFSGNNASSNNSAPVGIGSPVKLGQPFTLYGITFEEMVPSIDGYLCTNPAEAGADNTPDCPLPAEPSDGKGERIYVNHKNWQITSGLSGVYYEYFRESPHPHAGCGVSVFSWIGLLPSGASSGTAVSFQVLLFDTGDILVQHLVSTGTHFGDHETIGIQNAKATSGLAYGCPSPITNNADSRAVLFELVATSTSTAPAGAKVIIDSGANGGSSIPPQTFIFNKPITIMGKDIATETSAGTLRYGPDFDQPTIIVDGVLVNIFDAHLRSAPGIAIRVINGGHLHLCDSSILGSGTNAISVESGSRLTLRRTEISDPAPRSESHVVLGKATHAEIYKSIISDSWEHGIVHTSIGAGAATDITIEKSSVVRNRKNGVELNSVRASIIQSTITDNLGIGMILDKSIASTSSSNITDNFSGGVSLKSGSQLNMNHCVFAGNQSAVTGALQNFLIDGSSSVTSLGSNLTDTNETFFSAASDIDGTNPKLTPLGGYGEEVGAASPRKVAALMCQIPLHNSPLIDASASTPTVNTSGTDMRNLPRRADGDNSGSATLDIGAVEAPPFIEVTTAADQNNSPPGPNVSLREALATSTGERVVFAPGMNGQVINLSASAGGQGSGLAAASAHTFVDASSLASGVTISGGGDLNSTLMAVNLMHGLTLTGGRKSAVRNFGGNLVMSSCKIVSNSQIGATNAQEYSVHGGGVFNGDVAFITDCIFEGNACSTDLLSTAAGAGYACFPSSGTGLVVGAGISYLINCRFENNQASYTAGGVYTLGGRKTVIDRCTFIENTATVVGGASVSAVSEDNTYIDITRSSFIKNSALNGYGGLSISGTVTIPVSMDVIEKGNLSYCTFDGNFVQDGIFGGLAVGAMELDIEHCTISNNYSTSFGGLSVREDGTVRMRNTIIDNNISYSGAAPSPSNLTLIDNAVFVSLGHNLTGDAIANFDHSSDQTNTPPILAPITLSTVAVPTRHPLHGSPAIDGGIGDGFAIDARGYPGKQGSAVDIGACETGSPVVVTTTVDDFNTPSGAQVSLREALRDAREGSRVTFSTSSIGANAIIDLRSAASGQGTTLDSDKNIVIDALMLPNGVTVRGPSSGLRCLTLPDGEQSFSTHGVSFSHGEAATNGSAIYKGLNTDLTISHAAVHDSISSNNAGALHANGGTLTLLNVTLANNGTTQGASALSARNGAQVSLQHCTIFNNQVTTTNFPGGSAILLETNAELSCSHVALAGNLTANSTARSLIQYPFGNTSIGDIERTYADDSTLPGSTLSTVMGFHPLQNAGGVAKTCPPTAGSNTVDAGYTLLASGLATDARGFARKYGTKVDIGAYELGSFLPGTTDPPIDSGGNGIDDFWEEFYGYIPNHPSVAGSDNDSDELSALGEYLSGTNPNVANTIVPLAILATDYVTPSGQVILTFASSPGIAYQIWYSSDLSANSFTKIIDVYGALSSSATQVLIEPSTFGGGTRGFFRVQKP